MPMLCLQGSAYYDFKILDRLLVDAEIKNDQILKGADIVN